MNGPTVAVNAAILERGISGSARATSQLCQAIAEELGVEVVEVRPGRPRSRNRWLNAIRDAHWDLRGAARSAGDVDVLLSPCNIGRARGQQSHLLVVFDSMIFECPELFDGRFAVYAQTLIRYSLNRADLVLTLSEHARQHLLRLAPQADIRVIRLPGRRTQPPRVDHPNDKVALVVGATEPHKSQVTAVRAIAQVRNSTGVPLRLRLIGPPGRAESEVDAVLRELDREGAWTSREVGLSDDEIDRAYDTAWVLLQPSLNEGYGLPLVEAAQRGLPVVHSGCGAMSEVLPTCSAGGPAVSDFTAAVKTLLDPAEWARRADDVHAEAGRFAWDTFRADVGTHLRDLLRRP